MCTKKITIQQSYSFEPKNTQQYKYAIKIISLSLFKKSLKENNIYYNQFSHIVYQHQTSQSPNLVINGSSIIDLYNHSLLDKFNIAMNIGWNTTAKIERQILDMSIIDAAEYETSNLKFSVITDQFSAQPILEKISKFNLVAAQQNSSVKKVTFYPEDLQKNIDTLSIDFQFEKIDYPEALQVSITKAQNAKVENGVVNLTQYFQTKNIAYMSFDASDVKRVTPAKGWSSATTDYPKYDIKVNDIHYKDISNQKSVWSGKTNAVRPICSIDDNLTLDFSDIFSKSKHKDHFAKSGVKAELILWTRYGRPYALPISVFKDTVKFSANQLTEIKGL